MSLVAKNIFVPLWQKPNLFCAEAVGTTGRVLNELTVKSVNDVTADDLDDEILAEQ